MDDEIEELVKLIHLRYFPEIKGNIKVIREDSKEYYCATNEFQKTIYYDKKIFKFTKKAQIAIIAHEMSHIKFRFKLISIFSFLSSKFESKLERLCDMEVIKKGLIGNLIQFHKEHDKLGFVKYKKSDGLTLKEIKKLI